MEDLLTETPFFTCLCYVHPSNQHLSLLLGIRVVKALTFFLHNPGVIWVEIYHYICTLPTEANRIIQISVTY